jgi:transposase
MMGRQAKGQQQKMFYAGFDLEQRVRQNHPLRRVKQLVDFDFIYQEVAPLYGANGNVSIPPPVILKLMLVLIFYNVRSERELMATLPERLDWLWFLGFDLDDHIPDHSVLSKARSRWGAATFQHFFERIVCQCVAAGLVDGSRIFLDSSLIKADAANNSIINLNSLKSQLNRHYKELEARLAEPAGGGKGKGQLNRTHVSTTDPDASLVSQGKVRSQLSFKTHRAVDGQAEVITATETTSGAVNEGQLLSPLMDQHTENTGSQVEVVVADSQYGTTQNYLACHDRGIEAHLSPFKDGRPRHGKFSEAAFTYDPQEDVYLCPAGQRLKRRRYDGQSETFQYQCKTKVCRTCPLRSQCTDAQRGRTLKRHLRQEEIQLMRERAQGSRAQKDLRTRQHLMERSFAQAVRFGFKRARWRGLWRVRIQEYLTAAIQNIMILMRYVKEPKAAISSAMKKARGRWLSIKEAYWASIKACSALMNPTNYFPWAGCS